MVVSAEAILWPLAWYALNETTALKSRWSRVSAPLEPQRHSSREIETFRPQ